MNQDLRHVLEAQRFDEDVIKEIFTVASALEDHKKNHQLLDGMFVSMLFFESSYRTRTMFEIAIKRLGGTPIEIRSDEMFSSSAVDDANLRDVIRMYSETTNLIILRHGSDDASMIAAEVATVPVLNAGCGNAQHPSKALVDLYTVKDKLGRIDNLEIALVGDLINGRVVQSLCYLLGKKSQKRLHFVAPMGYGIKSGIKDYLARHGVEFLEHWSMRELQEVLPSLDVLYVNGVAERAYANPIELHQAQKAMSGFKITNTELALLSESAIIMHPMPRKNEIAIDPETDKRCVFIQQSSIYTAKVDMALLIWMTNVFSSKPRR